MSLIFEKRVFFLPKCSQFGKKVHLNSEKVRVGRKRVPFVRFESSRVILNPVKVTVL